MKSAKLRVDGEKIRLAREFAGFTQEATAKKIGIDRSAVAKWESGERQPGAPVFKAFCKAVKVTPESLLAVPDEQAA